MISAAASVLLVGHADRAAAQLGVDLAAIDHEAADALIWALVSKFDHEPPSYAVHR